MLIIKIPDNRVMKARKSAKLVPEIRTVSRDGTTYQATFWVDPDNKGMETPHKWTTS